MKLTSRLLAAGITFAFATTPTHAGLIGHWKFDDGSGTTAADSSTNGYDADVHTTEGTSAWIAGKAGGAYNQPRFTLDAAESDVLNLAGTGTVTLSLWMTTHNTSQFGGIAGFEGTGSTGDIYSLKMDNADKINWTVLPSHAAIASSDTLTNYAAATADGWVHVVGVFEQGVGSTLYVNGAVAATGAAGSPIPDKTTPSLFRIGTYWNSNSYEFNGAVDDVQLYDQALSTGDVAFLFNNPGSVLGGGPVTVAMGAPSANTVTDDGATVECQVLNDDADDVTVVWAHADQGETDVSTWTGAAGGGSHSFGAASQDDVLSHGLSGLDGDTEYFFRFLATAGGDSDWSIADSFATGLGGSPAPADLAGTPETTPVGNNVDLTWTDSYANETGFVIQRSTDPGFGTFDEFTTGADVTSYTDETADPNTTYYYRIAAEGSSGTGPFSSNLEVTTGDPPTTGLLAHWTFDDGSGTTAADSSGSGYDADQTIAAGSWITGKAGGAYDVPRFSLDAAESDVLNLGGGSAVTLSAWVTVHGIAQFGGIAGFEGTGASGDIYSLKMDNADKIVWTVSGSSSFASADTLTNYAAATGDGWVHLVGVFEEGVGSTLYVNGAVAGTGAAGNPIPDKTPPGTFNIGRYYNSSGYTFGGAVDDVQVYNLAAGADDVSFLYNNPGSVLGEETTFQLVIAPNAGTPGSYDFTWAGMDAKVYDLVSSTDLSTAPDTWPVWSGNENIAGTAPTNTLTGVPGGGDSARFFAVIEKDPPPLFSEDFEADNGGFTVATTSGTDWAHGDPDSSGLGGSVTTGSGGSTNCWGTGIGNPGFYADPTDTCLRSAVIDLTGVAAAELTFAQALDLETGDSVTVNVIDDTTDTVIAADIVSITDTDDSSADWESAGPVAIPAGALGQTVRIEWCLSGVGGTTDDYMGWYIDDVVVSATAP